MTTEGPTGPDSSAIPPELLLRLILQAIGEGIHGVDREGRITFVNAAAEPEKGHLG